LFSDERYYSMNEITAKSINDARKEYLDFVRDQISILALDFLNKNPVFNKIIIEYCCLQCFRPFDIYGLWLTADNLEHQKYFPERNMGLDLDFVIESSKDLRNVLELLDVEVCKDLEGTIFVAKSNQDFSNINYSSLDLSLSRD
jgi:hypothetical protein